MKHFAEGFQYKVYDIGNNRVLKKTQSYLYTFFKVFVLVRERENASIFKAFVVAVNSNKENKRALQKMKEKMKVIPLDLFANPEFIGDTLNFTQDKVTPVEDYLIQSSLENNKKIVDGYIELQKLFWSYGIHDSVYKFQPNYGVNSQGKVVCIDFGEFIFTKLEALKNLEKGKWFFRLSYKKWAESEIKTYYTDAMKRTMVKDVLQKYWNTKIPNSV
ncbi:MAG: hypothetical protein AAB726_00850 [Patescibacteria group bacterium]